MAAQVTSSLDAVEQAVAALGSVVVKSPLYHADPLSLLVQQVDLQTGAGKQNEPSSAPIAFIGHATDLFRGLGHLSALAQSPVVLNVAVEDDYSTIAALRQSSFVVLQSFGPEDAQSIAIVADLVARQLSRPVVHFFPTVTRNAPFTWSPELVAGTLAALEPSSDEAEAEEIAKTESEAAPEGISVQEAKTEAAVAKAISVAAQQLQAYEYRGPNDATRAILLFGNADTVSYLAAEHSPAYGVLTIRVLNPLNANKLLEALPASVTELSVAEQVSRLPTRLLPVFQDLFGADDAHLSHFADIKSFRLGHVSKSFDIDTLFSGSGKGELVGDEFAARGNDGHDGFGNLAAQAGKDRDETVYVQVLRQLFPHLHILNEKTSEGGQHAPEFAFGQYLAADEHRQQLVAQKKEEIKNNKSAANPELSQWTSSPYNPQLIAKLQDESLKAEFQKQEWIVGSDSWAFDYGMSGVHHVLASGKNVKMLVIESAAHATTKKDIGLYAMSFGNVYAASVAVYASYTQLLQALLEAQAFNGPAVVVAYLPTQEGEDALHSLKRTKQAVESGFWPLYRFNAEGSGDIKLDSYVLKQSLKDFLSREQKLTMLAKKTPQLARTLAQSSAQVQRSQQKAKAEQSYAKLLEGLSGPPVLVLYASDGGQAEMVGKRLARRAAARGLKARALQFDDIEDASADLTNETNVVFVTSTAGQGEFPQNGRQLWDQLKQQQVDMGAVHTAVFGMGDSQYWPRKQDKHYYNKPAQDLAKRLTVLGSQELVPLHLGDDQDADGWSTAYKPFEEELWKALGVDQVDGGDEPKPLTNEDMKRDSNFLRGNIAEELVDESTGSVNAVNQQLTKFHGIYMQDDRDIREERKQQGLEPAFAFMIRVRLPGCRATPEQWLAIDRLSDERGNGTFKITTRATFQLHGVIKENLKPAIRGMNSALMDTLAACGDVDRNVVTSASVQSAKVHAEVASIGRDISQHLLPRTTAYYEIWLEGKDDSDGPGYQEAVNTRKEGPVKKPAKHLVAQSAPVLGEGAPDEEPLYKPLYLPRKFKINIAVPPYNDVDVYGHDIGLISIIENNSVIGFNVLIGGGMGTTHNNRKTYPRTGSLIGYTPKEKILDVCEKIMLVQRDNGDRQNRKHARLKYTVDDMTVEGFKSEVEKYLGYPLEEAREHPAFKTNVDTYGWIRDENGYNHFTTFVENGRVEDTPELQHRHGFRAIAHLMQKYRDEKQSGSAELPGEFRLTANQHIVVANITDSQKAEIDEVLKQYKLDNLAFSGLRLSSAACVAFPTCGLAMAESERYLPELVTKLEQALEEYGLRHDSVVMRMTGCPNGCARPWLAEVALVGKAYGAYNLMLGGGHVGQRLNKLYRSSLKEDEILATLKPMFKAWALERTEGEPFGDFVIRKGIIKATREGKDWWDDVEPGLE